jgi:uncharacterized membrane protein
MANIGGAVTAPIVASAFDPALAPVGVLLAVLGYALGTCKIPFSSQVASIRQHLRNACLAFTFTCTLL